MQHTPSSDSCRGKSWTAHGGDKWGSKGGGGDNCHPFPEGSTLSLGRAQDPSQRGRFALEELKGFQRTSSQEPPKRILAQFEGENIQAAGWQAQWGRQSSNYPATRHNTGQREPKNAVGLPWFACTTLGAGGGR